MNPGGGGTARRRNSPGRGTSRAMARLGVARRVRAGPHPEAGPAWPDGAAVAVALSFDSRITRPSRCAASRRIPASSPRARYGARVAVPRILRLPFDRHRVPASFFVPAVSALLHPAGDRQRAQRGQDIEAALHGWIHEWNATHSTATPSATRSCAGGRCHRAAQRVAPCRQCEHRSWDFSENTLDLIREDCTSRNRLVASWLTTTHTNCWRDGCRRTGIVEIPVEWICATMRRTSRMDRLHQASDPDRTPPPSRGCCAMLDRRIRAGVIAEHGLFQLTMHPHHHRAHRSRIVVLAELLERIAASQ